MRALVLEDWWKLVVAGRPDPAAHDDWVLLEVHATGICGSDIHGYTNENKRRRLGQVMGHETVGRIVALGPDVPEDLNLHVGDVATVNPVMSCGHCEQCLSGNDPGCPTKSVIGVDPTVSSAFAELLAAPAANVIPLPASMPIDYGALVEPLAVGYHAVRRGRVGPSDRVLVIGGGPIGQACVLAAQRQGVGRVAVSEPSPSRRRLVEALGTTAVDPVAASSATGGLKAATGEALGGPPTIVIDAVGLSATVDAAFDVAPLGSSIVLVGMGAAELAVRAYEVSTKERMVIGSFCYTADEFRATARWVGAAPAELGVLIDGHTDLEGSDAAFTELAKGENPASKVLVLPQA
ncbi:MAG TPA: alcohol dehydrogenase catalytic domain-containing protein [Acidimicrobiales bacterium]|nr:alcohol dehydrogenase catalytic domain-containing protein [Acidimicrobiales bacterium]